MASTLPAEVISRADSLRSLVVAVITDDLAPIAIRNHCHRLMLAIEKNNQTLVNESLINLVRAAENTGYQLPHLNLNNPALDRSSGAPEPFGQP